MREREIIEENKRRLKKFFYPYNPLIGDKTSMVCPRVKVKVFNQDLYLPKEFVKSQSKLFANIDKVKDTKKNRVAFDRIRCKYDFEFFCYRACRIEHKLTAKIVPLLLNYGQRKIVKEFEDMRLNNIPIDIVLVKSRQYGGSTVVQMYILWIQMFWKKQWHSFTAAAEYGQSENISRMIDICLDNMPKDIANFQLKNIGKTNTKTIKERNCRITLCASTNPNAPRSQRGSCLHLSECATFKDTKKQSGDLLAQSLGATVPAVPYSVKVLESTAMGVGNFFHKEYLDAISNKFRRMVFVSFYEIDMYSYLKMNNGLPERDKKGNVISLCKDDYHNIISTMGDYERWQWECGCTLESIKWYQDEKKRRRYSDFQMKSEYPITAEEAFQSFTRSVFNIEARLFFQQNVKEPAIIGEILADSFNGKSSLDNIRFQRNDNEEFFIWNYPEIKDKVKQKDRYLVVVDLGGASITSDWSVITVFDRKGLLDLNHQTIEVVARWRGHREKHNDIAWLAAQIAKFYDNALLVVEINTLIKDDKIEEQTPEGRFVYTVIDTISEIYDNVYARSTESEDSILAGKAKKYGFHTNEKSKYLAYGALKDEIADKAIIDHDQRTVNELSTLIYDNNNKINAAKGYKDDICDTIAIGCLISKNMDIPTEIPTIDYNNPYVDIDIPSGVYV
ncbi:MAG: hypothetical protein LBM67_08430 [Lentimicrobiaceae bacterium]|jgi:hypothetical protein|nr:hypothetical protein [Lentimicrobiaceae bacterium]